MRADFQHSLESLKKELLGKLEGRQGGQDKEWKGRDIFFNICSKGLNICHCMNPFNSASAWP